MSEVYRVGYSRIMVNFDWGEKKLNFIILIPDFIFFYYYYLVFFFFKCECSRDRLP
jgi:hypothetical protein